MTSIERLTTIGGGSRSWCSRPERPGTRRRARARRRLGRRPRAGTHQVEVGNPTIGKRLFTQKGCVQCHAIRGQGGQVGPDLGRIPHAHNLSTMAAVIWNHSPEMREVMAARGIKRPEFHGAELVHLLACLHRLEVIGDPAKGRQLLAAKGCAQRHAIRGDGGKIGPGLALSTHPHPPIELTLACPTATGSITTTRPIITTSRLGSLVLDARDAPERREGSTMRGLVASLMGVTATGVPFGAWAEERPWEGWGWHPMWGMGGAWGVGMLLFMVLFWGLLLVGLALGIRWLVRESQAARSDPALDLLRQRYARGEINKEEFEAKKRDLA